MEEQKDKKGAPPPRYDTAFKAGAVKMVAEQGRDPKEVARDLGICIDTLRSWLKASGMQLGQVSRYNREQQRIRELEEYLQATGLNNYILDENDRGVNRLLENKIELKEFKVEDLFTVTIENEYKVYKYTADGQAYADDALGLNPLCIIITKILD